MGDTYRVVEAAAGMAGITGAARTAEGPRRVRWAVSGE